MEFLHMLWDETLAGPTPDTGLGKLRKCDSFSAATSRPRRRVVAAAEDHNHVVVSRSITVLRNNSNFKNLSVDTGSAPPDSPSGSSCSSPTTPLTPGTPTGDFKRFTRRKSSAAAVATEGPVEPRSPTVYDWIVISALDR